MFDKIRKFTSIIVRLSFRSQDLNYMTWKVGNPDISSSKAVIQFK